jgi:hypothetical protein
MPVRLPALLALVLLLPLALVACGGGDDDEQEPGGTAATGTAAATGTTAQGGGGGGGSDDDLAAFTGLVGNSEGSAYLVTYDVVSEDQGETTTGRWTMAQDPPRTAMIIESEGERIWVIDDGTDQYTCFGNDDEGQCLKSGGGLGTEAFNVDEVVAGAEEGEVREIDGRRIAGREARCFQYTGSAPDDTGVMCLDARRGYVLLIESEGFTMTAVDVQESVPASTFEPPFEVIG